MFFSFYLGNDGIAVNNTAQNGERRQSISWGNNAGSIRYSKVWSPKLYSNMVLGHTKYKYTEMSVSEQRTEGDGQNYSYKFLSAINDNFLNINFEIYPLEKLKLKTGYGITVHHFSPGETIANRPETGNNRYPEFRLRNITCIFRFWRTCFINSVFMQESGQPCFILVKKIIYYQNHEFRFYGNLAGILIFMQPSMQCIKISIYLPIREQGFR